MAIMNKFFKVLALMIVVVMLSANDNTLAVHGQCQGDLQGLITYCSHYVQKGSPPKKPSPPCCNAVKKTDVKCACKHITPDVERMVDMAKVVHVAAVCGKALPHGSKCGSYTVP